MRKEARRTNKETMRTSKSTKEGKTHKDTMNENTKKDNSRQLYCQHNLKK